MSSTTVLPLPHRPVRTATRASAALPSSALDAMLDATYETHRQFRHGAFADPCPTCHVPAGELCLARRSVHAARRLAHRVRVAQTEPFPRTAARAC
ncbi:MULTISPECIES: hypothetical protein [Streptomyces]|uniref:Uncharacterized protein n=1 Tax=Streptomyces cinereoruber TaxID=67260 RepID=A0AAV4KEW2_9ACTN|nr:MULTISPECIES: hypothetical protein [Streptomyces]MBB4158825.1 hypothetical protein [Streptomyces cinereoruber]MBY8816557.1 hypothetical protein [Streptomyces cinereoruber]NIH65243.1 hypothetical protein [Streptomyces cinereoruber]GGR19880.1 hypothetical protein GCM10010497_22550 [Streptomyces cinereoruber]